MAITSALATWCVTEFKDMAKAERLEGDFLGLRAKA